MPHHTRAADGPAALPVFWVTGAAGVGKSAAAWALWRRLAAEGVVAAYVDIDQLGMVDPLPDDDPWAHRVKATALDVLLPGYRAFGAQVVIVSGVVDVDAGPRAQLSRPDDLTLVALDPSPEELRRRLADRGWEEPEIVEGLGEQAALTSSGVPEVVVSTAARTVDATVEELLPRVRRGAAAGAVSGESPSTVRVPVFAITGPRAAGTSTLGFALASRRWQLDVCTGFVDTEQLSFLSGVATAVRAELARHQLARMHERLAAGGAGLLVVGGRPVALDERGLRRCLGAAPLLLVRLAADRPTYDSHVRSRYDGSEARLAGDDLVGATDEHLAAVVTAALAEQDRLDAAGGSATVVSVAGRSVADVLVELEAMLVAQGLGV